MTPFEEATGQLLGALAASARGPRRDGTFAVWLTVRVAGDIVGAAEPTERAHRRRLQALSQRFTSLTLAPPLRRALASALGLMEPSPTPETAAAAVAHLVTPARETLGPEAADAVRRVAVSLRGR